MRAHLQAMLLSSALFVAPALPTFAQEKAAPEKEKDAEQILYELAPDKKDVFKFDYGAPVSPAMTLLGLTPDKTPPSSSLTEFALTIPSLYGSEGGQGIALDMPPARFFEGEEKVTLTGYVDGTYLRRLAYRTRVGVAALNGSDGGGDASKAVNSKLSIGLSTSIFDDSDPLMADSGFLKRCLVSVVDSSRAAIDEAARQRLAPDRIALFKQAQLVDDMLARPPSAGQPDDQEPRKSLLKERDSIYAEIAKLNAPVDKATTKNLTEAGIPQKYDRCADRAVRMAHFGRDLDFGVGAMAQGEPGRLEDLEWRGTVVWAALRQPLWVSGGDDPDWRSGFDGDGNILLPKSAVMLVLSGRASWDETVASGNKTTPSFRADTVDAWAGLELMYPAFRLAAQYGWLDVQARDAFGKPFERSGERYLVSAQFQVGSDSPLWLGVSYGNGYGTVGDLDAETALVTLSYSPGRKSISGD